METSEGNVDPITVLEPNFTFPTPTDDLVPEVQDPCRWLLGAHHVRTKAEVPNKPEVWERILCEERTNLFDQRKEGRVHIVTVAGKFGIEKAGIDIANSNEFKGRVRREKDVGGDPIGRFPMPLGIRGTDELSKVGAPISERNGHHMAGVS